MDKQNITGAAEANAAAEKKTEGTAEKPEQKMFSQEDVNKIISDRLSRESAKWEAKLLDAQKMAEMTAEQKAQYQKEQHEQELLQREQEVTKRELQMTAKEALIEKGLPVELSEVLNYADAEACTKSIDAVEKAFRNAVEEAVDKRIKQSAKTPKTGDNGGMSGVEAAFYGLNPNLKNERN